MSEDTCNNMTYVFFKNFLISGLIIGIASVLIEYCDSGLAGFIYGSMPIGFIYLLYLTQSTKKNGIHLSYNAAIGGLLFAMYTMISYLLLKYTNFHLLANISLVIILYILLIYIVKKGNLIF